MFRSVPNQQEYVEVSDSNDNASPEEGPTAAVDSDVDVNPVSPADEAGPELTELETVTAERDKFREQLLRTAADFENYRKRARRDVEEARRRSKEDVLREVLLVIDNLERAVEASAAATDPKQVADGVEMVLRGFDEVCGRVNMSRQEVVGEAFDPALHDAVQQMESPDHPIGTVSAQVRAGYMLDEKLLRPAMVVVSKGPPAGADQPADEGSPSTDED